MEAVFLKLLNMSINASWLVLAIVLLRFILKKAPKNIRVILWSLVGIRLVCPFSFESVLSLIPSKETVPQNIMMSPSPEIHTGFPSMNTAINPIISESLAPNPGDSVNPLQVITFIAAVLWLVGMAAMLIYTLVSYLLIRKKTNEAILLKENIYIGDRIATPFILGVIKPKIYLPSGMNEADTAYVIAHEKAHIKRRDHLWKPLGFLLLTVYWFNPVLWLAYVLLCRDIELACDEKVISDMGTENKKPYAEALINCSVPRKLITACPVAFGETEVKGRIKSVLSYKKPALWLIIIAVLLSIAAAVGFMTDPKDSNSGDILGKSFKGDLVYTSINFSGGGTIDMGICDIGVDGELEIKHDDHIVKYGTLSECHFTRLMLYSGIEVDKLEDFSIDSVAKAYELKTKDSVGFDPSFIFFVTDTGEFYRANIHKNGSVLAVFRLYEVDSFDKNFESGLDSLENAVGSIILDKNKNSFYLSSLDTVDDGMKTAAVESHDIIHYMKSDMDNTWTVYAQMLYEEYIRYPEGNVEQVSAQASPVKIVFKITKDGQYKLKKYVQPNPEPHGMPDDFMKYLYNVPGYDDAATMKKLRIECYDKASDILGHFTTDLFENLPDDYYSCIDKINFDIDGDMIVENCYLSCGPTSGIFTFCFKAFENGKLEYFNIFAPGASMNLCFEIDPDSNTLQVRGRGQSLDTSRISALYNVSVYEDADKENIRLSSDGNSVAYWGEQGIESTWAEFSGSADLDYLNELRGRYPFYFDLPTEDGLALYVWQMSESNYQCTLVNDKSIEHPMKIVLNFESVNVDIMKHILESYNLSEEDTIIKPYQNPASSYIYDIDDDYQERINALFDR